MSLDSYKSVLVTGATGLAGSGVLRCLLDRHPHLTIRAVTYKHMRPFFRHPRVHYAYGDLRQAKDCHRLARGCEAAVMTSGVTPNAFTAHLGPENQVNENVLLNIQFLNALGQAGVRRTVFVSSAAVYQEFGGAIKESELDMNVDPPPAYFGIGWTMRFFEKMCRFWHERTGMEILIARAANIFGPCDRFDPMVSRFIAALIRRAVDKEDPFEVWGRPEVARDVIYIDDFAEAVRLMLDHDTLRSDTFNIGSGVATTVGQVVSWILGHAGHDPEQIVYHEHKPMTLAFRCLDCSKARRLLGWKPEHTVEVGIRKTLQWWKANMKWWRI